LNSSFLPRVTGLFRHPVALAQLLNEVPVGLALLDRRRRIVFVNRVLEALTGFSWEEASGLPCMFILRSNRCPHDCPLLTLRADSQPSSLDANIVNRHRRKIPVRLTVAPITDLSGNLVGFVEAVEDLQLLKELDEKVGKGSRFSHVIGRSAQMERIFQILPVLAQTDSTVLISGETGTGKDLVAEAIHLASTRAKGLFVKINCGALPEALLESELFGHQKGAFTGAVENKPGRFRLAHNGTLYLTEIGDLPLPLQVKLLMFLDDKVVYPLGSTRGYQVDVRVIAATHRNLEQMVREERFREDLLFRLNVVRLHLPPLRERGDDIHLLLDHFLRTLASRFKKVIKGFSSQARKILLDYHYPGNVRELRNVVEYAVNICDTEHIQPHHLPTYLSDRQVRETAASLPEEPRGPVLETEPSRERSNRGSNISWAAAERAMIMEALIKSGGRRSQAAALLGWGRSTLWRKMKQYGISS
jgi:two-component system, NtrC family, response regulator AtoC